MIRIGDYRIDIINDAQIKIEAGGVFGLVPRALWSRSYTFDEENRVEMHHNCLLVRGEGHTIVVDTGLGTRLDEKTSRRMALERPKGDLVSGLRALGVEPEQVDLVINTHLHADHCGGNMREHEETLLPTFPNAEYWVQRLEFADAMYPNERSRGTYYPDNYAPLHRAGQLRLLDGDTLALPGIRCLVTPGHTRAHQSVLFEADEQKLLYIADLSTFAVHFERLAWMTAYDVEPLVTLETKRKWQRWALEHKALILFEHDPLTVAARLVQVGDRVRLETEQLQLEN
ncbi:MAG: MBL fold metallo-hydrolase [Chloroflexi bacterium]|nr:MBL fold metallo-hydrolase [Chloroflexota bacterium]